MTITQQPTAIHTAFNPIVVKCGKELAETEAIIKTAFGNHDTLPTTYITKSREYFNGLAIFDLKGILKTAFTDEVLFTEYSVFNGHTNTLLFKSLALNSVVQIGHSSDKTNLRGTFLTEFDRILFYPGYERNISCLAFETGSTYVRFNGDAHSSTTDKHFNVAIAGQYSIELSNNATDPYLRDNQGRQIVTNAFLPIEVISLPDGFVQNAKEVTDGNYSSPFYIKWINQQGGWDYWMFSHRQYITRAVANPQTFKPYVQDQQTAKSYLELVKQDGIEKIKVGASSMSENEFECVSKLIYSPMIQWFNEDTGLWSTIQVDGDGSNENDTRSTLKGIELTFLLPTPQLQF